MHFGGYMGKLLFVNLSDKTTREVQPDEQLYRQYIGGYGLGARILYEHLQPGVDPLGPENMIGFVAGTFTGTKAHAAGRFHVVAKSPLTGGWGDSSCGGNFGPKLKSTGYDGVFFSGKAEKPVYIFLDDGRLEFCDAADVWGKDCSDTETWLKEKYTGRNIGVMSIGQAGENQLRIANIMHDYGRAAGRLGLGAVMGAKMLKAFVVCGTHQVPVADPEAFQKQLDYMVHNITQERTPMANRLGTSGTGTVYDKNIAIQDCPVQNWRSLGAGNYSLDQAMKLSGPAYAPYVKRRYACAQCPVACGAIIEFTDSEGRTQESHRPEYETIGAFGSLCLVDDIQTVMEANEACNRYGMDSISTGGTIAFAMECFEKGLIRPEDINGMDLSWGNKDALVPLIRQMAYREGIGAVLADGSRIAAHKLGQGAIAYAMQAGGVELPMHDPRCWPGFGYSYALDPTPGIHCKGPVGFIEHGWTDRQFEEIYNMRHLPDSRYAYENKGEALKLLSHWYHFFNGTGLCILGKYCYYRYPTLELLKAITGWEDFDMEEALACGERVNTLRQQFNVNEGISFEDFKPPGRVLGDPPFLAGPTAGVTVDVETVRRDYYREMDWDYPSGRPSRVAIERLGLTQLIP
ncbi:MAG: aldehyde ferredoxin oxidoreductase family protein [Clostridiales bacterium]|nr:aldehyde ferredoxin oxidoreductase family protein [Clostridiales bacterium]